MVCCDLCDLHHKNALGGRIADEVVFGKQNVTIGASSDLMLVTHYGFNETLDNENNALWKFI